MAHWRTGVTPANFKIKCICSCAFCGKFSKLKSKRALEKAPNTFCNSSCQVKWQNLYTDFNKRENNPAYRHGQRVGGSTPEYGQKFTSKLKRSVKIRDGYNCQHCGNNFSGKLSKKLDIHHIDEDKFNNCLSNLISLCKSCHTKLHWKLLNKGD